MSSKDRHIESAAAKPSALPGAEAPAVGDLTRLGLADLIQRPLTDAAALPRAPAASQENPSETDGGANGGANRLTLTAAGVLDMTNNGLLSVLGDAQDTVTVGSDWSLSHEEPFGLPTLCPGRRSGHGRVAARPRRENRPPRRRLGTMARGPAHSPNPWASLVRVTASLALALLLLTASAAAEQPALQTGEIEDQAPSEPHSREYLIKAAILYNFARFTRWPAEAFASADAPLELCVIGVDPFGDALATLDGKRVGSRSLNTRLIAEPAMIDGCHVLFVSASERGRLAEVLAASSRAAVLTVADIPEFSQAGGIITLNIVEDRTRFDVNRLAADRAGLALSAKLLRLADSVIQN